MRAGLLALALLACAPAAAQTAALAPAAAAAATVEPSLDPRQEVRAQKLGGEIRCVVCENEPVSQSSADMAVDMRRVIRERIAAGDTDAQIRDYFATRYGDFVLLNPRFSVATLLLWVAPFVLLLAGAGVLILQSRRRTAPAAEAPLPGAPDDAEARAALRTLDGPSA